MKLSRILNLRDQLAKVDLKSFEDNDHQLATIFKALLETSHSIDPNLILPLEETVLEKQKATRSLVDYLENYIDKNMLEQYPTYCAQSNHWIQQINKHDYTQWIEHCLNIYRNLDQLIKFSSRRVSNLSTWQLPALVYHVDNVEYLPEVFGFYPIYVVDKWKETKTSIENHYTQSQVRKIRFYELDQLKDFPMGSMGLVMSRNHFTHCSIEQFTQQLSWLIQTLLPGGRILFNFNDCENAACADLFEKKQRSFMLGSEVKNVLNTLGLMIKSWDYLDSPGTVWVEAQLPGVFVSKKRAEPLGVILSK